MPRKATKKANKATESDASDVNAPIHASKHEPDEPELNAASIAAIGKEGEPRPRSVPTTASDGESEAMAEAADTFEDASEDRLPSERHEHPVVNVAVPELENATEDGEDESGDAAEPEPGADDEDGAPPVERAPVRLERLQKILSQAGVASRRHAEEMIAQGRIQVNGTVVTELGTKADPDRDHIRVDGKLIHRAERLRYFVLNKPRGYVTTVSDPEGRPTVMEFFRKMGERLYPVGRLDYQSEGLLLVTNDGDLANKLTKAATGVEKTYLVKVSGQPSPEELDRLREGVAIDRTRPGEGRVRTGSAIIREARPGDNPWYEVVLTEGRNRELRKMFEEIGHHVEKIRRVGYGPLVLDVEPGQLRELEANELEKLRLAAEGKWRKPLPKPKEVRHEGGRRPSRREAQPYKERRHEDRGGRGERASSSRPPQGKGGWRRPAAQDEGYQRPRPASFGRTQESERPGKPAWRSQGATSDRRQPEVDREGVDRRAASSRGQGNRPKFHDRQERTSDGGRAGSRPPRSEGAAARDRESGGWKDRRETGARYQGNRPRFEDRTTFEDRGARRGPGSRTGSRPPRREAAPPQEGFVPSRPPKGRFAPRGERPAGQSPSRAGTSRPGGPTAGRSNRPPGTRGGRAPFKNASGRGTTGRGGFGRDRSKPRGGPRKRPD